MTPSAGDSPQLESGVVQSLYTQSCELSFFKVQIGFLHGYVFSSHHFVILLDTRQDTIKALGVNVSNIQASVAHPENIVMKYLKGE